MPLCKLCGVNERYVSPKGQRDSHCLPCRNQRDRDYRAKVGNRFRRYGLTREDLFYMWLYQGGRCLVCSDRIEIDTCHIDHDNSCCSKEITRQRRCCGECVRGMLCGSCNQGLGNFKDSITRLKGAIAYLTQMESR